MTKKLLNILTAVSIATASLASCAPQVYNHKVTSRTETVVKQVKKYDHDLTLTVREGENLTKIAERMNALIQNSDYPIKKQVTWQEIYEQNPQIQNPNLIFPGEQIHYDSSESSSRDKRK